MKKNPGKARALYKRFEEKGRILHAILFSLTDMKKTLLFSCFFLGLFLTAIGQTDNLILTNKQNEDWVDSLSKLSLDKKLTMINERVLNDTNVFVRHFYSDRIKAEERPSNKVYGDGKPVMIVNQNEMIMKGFNCQINIDLFLVFKFSKLKHEKKNLQYSQTFSNPFYAFSQISSRL